MAIYGLEEPGVSHDTLDVTCEEDPDDDIYYLKHEPLLTGDQRRIFNQLIKHIDANEGGLYTIDAPGGSGKTFLCNLILAYARKQKKIAIATALSGIAATLMTKGTTFHRRFGVPVDCTQYSTSSMKPTSNEAMTIKHAVIIFVDEVSMMKWNQLQVLDRLLRLIMSIDKPMGGKLVVLLHDFRQLLPVVPGGSRAHIICEAVINSHIWNNFTTFYLKTNMRVMNSRKLDDPAKADKLDEYAKWLLSTGDGTVETALQGTDIVEIKPNMCAKDIEDLNNKVYNEFSTNYNDPSYLKDRAIMSCTNDVIQKCNEEMINKIPGQALVCESVHSFLDDDDYLFHDTGPLTRINSSGLAPHKLVLKVGACIILIRNMSIQDGHCNGTRYIIISLSKHLIHARKLNAGGESGTILPTDDIFIPRIPMISKESDYPVLFKRLQFPILVSYYLTINRAQGQSLKRAGLYLPKNVFTHGHLYAGLSRCGDPDHVHICTNQEEFNHVSHLLDPSKKYTKNIVYKEILKPKKLYGDIPKS